jgi:hypothetical protein
MHDADNDLEEDIQAIKDCAGQQRKSLHGDRTPAHTPPRRSAFLAHPSRSARQLIPSFPAPAIYLISYFSSFLRLLSCANPI